MPCYNVIEADRFLFLTALWYNEKGLYDIVDAYMPYKEQCNAA